ncbi:MAG: hypothetical protein KatS3mg105_0474 [Gemmatales bacterium]|nr:MAG: hypothetical protein KatS3mg105_0474 [Gemmatales bacterium]
MKTSYRIGLVTCAAKKLRDYFPTLTEPDVVPREPPFTPDDQLVVDALRQRGHTVRPVVWGTTVEKLAEEFDCLVVRSPWDYMDTVEQRQRFAAWLTALDRCGLYVENHPRLMSWLIDKRYLLDLEAAGVPIVPTEWIAAGGHFDVAAEFDARGPLVIKPALSAAGVGLVHVPSREVASGRQQEIRSLCQREAYLIQTFLPEIEREGEWSLVYIGGDYSHAAHKMPGTGSILVHAEQGGSLRFAEPPVEVKKLADQVIRCLPAAYRQRHKEGDEAVRVPPLYLRIDVIPTATGCVVSECEGVEPELFFRARRGSEVLFCRHLQDRLASCADS